MMSGTDIYLFWKKLLFEVYKSSRLIVTQDLVGIDS